MTEKDFFDRDFCIVFSVTWRGGTRQNDTFEASISLAHLQQVRANGSRLTDARAGLGATCFFSKSFLQRECHLSPRTKIPPKKIENPLFETPKPANVTALPRQPWRRARARLLLLRLLLEHNIHDVRLVLKLSWRHVFVVVQVALLAVFEEVEPFFSSRRTKLKL